MENEKSLGYWYSFEFDETSGIYYEHPANKDKEAKTGSSVERCSACCVKSTGREKESRRKARTVITIEEFIEDMIGGEKT